MSASYAFQHMNNLMFVIWIQLQNYKPHHIIFLTLQWWPTKKLVEHLTVNLFYLDWNFTLQKHQASISTVLTECWFIGPLSYKYIHLQWTTQTNKITFWTKKLSSCLKVNILIYINRTGVRINSTTPTANISYVSWWGWICLMPWGDLNTYLCHNSWTLVISNTLHSIKQSSIETKFPKCPSYVLDINQTLVAQTFLALWIYIIVHYFLKKCKLILLINFQM